MDENNNDAADDDVDDDDEYISCAKIQQNAISQFHH